LEQEFGDRAGPRQRALAFVGTLAQNGIVLLRNAPGAPEATPTPVRRVTCARCSVMFHTADVEGTRLRCPACGAGRVG
jgi:hypothetical protein